MDILFDDGVKYTAPMSQVRRRVGGVIDTCTHNEALQFNPFELRYCSAFCDALY